MENQKQTNILEVKNLTVEYSSGKETIHAVNDVSFHLEYGKTLGLVGETGAGKTTIAKSILRILPKPPARLADGEIHFAQKNLLSLSENEMRKIRGGHISMIFQDPMTALNPIMRIGDQITDGIQIHQHITKQKAIEQAEKMLELVGIPKERFSEYPHQFSGGMKQRVIIAMALSCRPDLLIADEPTSALDVTIQAQIMEIIKELQEKDKTSMILITHDLGIIAESCDYVAIIYAGQIVEYGSKTQLFKETAHPYTLGLFDALPSLNTDVKRLKPIQGATIDSAALPEGCYFHPRCPYASEECSKSAVPLTNIGDGHLCRCMKAVEKDGFRKEGGNIRGTN